MLSQFKKNASSNVENAATLHIWSFVLFRILEVLEINSEVLEVGLNVLKASSSINRNTLEFVVLYVFNLGVASIKHNHA